MHALDSLLLLPQIPVDLDHGILGRQVAQVQRTPVQAPVAGDVAGHALVLAHVDERLLRRDHEVEVWGEVGADYSLAPADSITYGSDVGRVALEELDAGVGGNGVGELGGVAGVGTNGDGVGGIEEGIGNQAAELACCAKDGNVRVRHCRAFGVWAVVKVVHCADLGPELGNRSEAKTSTGIDSWKIETDMSKPGCDMYREAENDNSIYIIPNLRCF